MVGDRHWSAKSPALGGKGDRIGLNCEDDIQRTYLPVEQVSWLNLDMIGGCAEGEKFSLSASYFGHYKDMHFYIGREGYVHGEVRVFDFGCINDLALNDPQMSRRHGCFILDVDGCWYVKDMGSKNGVRVNGERISPDIKVPLCPEDHVRFGASVFYVESMSYAVWKRFEGGIIKSSCREENNLLIELVELAGSIERLIPEVAAACEGVYHEIGQADVLSRFRKVGAKLLLPDLEEHIKEANVAMALRNIEVAAEKLNLLLGFLKRHPLYLQWEEV